MVCSWEPIMVAVDRSMEKSRKLLLLEVTAGNSFPSTVPLMGQLLSVPENASSSVLEDAQLQWYWKPRRYSYRRGSFRNFVWILPVRVVVVLLRQLRRSRRGAVCFCVLWLWWYLSVQRLLSSARWLLFSCNVIREFLLSFLKGSTCLYRFHHATRGFFFLAC